MNLMKVTVFLGELGARSSATYTVAAGSAYEAAWLVSNHIGQRDPSGRIEEDALADEDVEGPPRVLGPVGDSVRTPG